jgi:DNA invertase Pin-like site-specific DNA recombinase
LAFIQADKADVLMTWESSRASRDLSTFLPPREALINRRMTWTTADDSFDLVRASDRKRISHEAVDNEHESGRTSERVQRSVRANAAKGRPHGRFEFRYRRIYTVDPHGRKSLTAVVEHEAEAPILREIARRFLASSARPCGRPSSTTPSGTSCRPGWPTRPAAPTSTRTVGNGYAGKARSGTSYPASPDAGYAAPA